MKTRLLMIGLIVATHVSVFSQNTTECKQVVLKFYKTLTNDTKLPDGKNALISYKVKTVPNKRLGGKVVSSGVTLKVNNQQAHVITDMLRIYQDEKMCVMVYPQKKEVVLRNSTYGDPLMQKITAKQNQTKFLEGMKVLSCTSEKGEGYDHKMAIQVPAAMKDQGVSRLVYYVSLKNRTVKKMYIGYDDEQPWKATTYTYEKIDFDYKTSELSKAVKARFLDRNGRLTSAYSGYTLKDHRKN